MTRLEHEERELHAAYVDIIQSRLDWCVETERYEMAARLRDLIEYETTEDEDVKTQYFLNLAKKYSPDFYESIKYKYKNKTLNV
jgi:hypothetical protein